PCIFSLMHYFFVVLFPFFVSSILYFFLFLFFFLIIRQPPSSTLFPYTTLFRSDPRDRFGAGPHHRCRTRRRRHRRLRRQRPARARGDRARQGHHSREAAALPGARRGTERQDHLGGVGEERLVRPRLPDHHRRPSRPLRQALQGAGARVEEDQTLR